MIGSKLPKLKTAFYESHFRHCAIPCLGVAETCDCLQNIPGPDHFLLDFKMIMLSFFVHTFILYFELRILGENLQCPLLVRIFSAHFW